jgi:phage protein D
MKTPNFVPQFTLEINGDQVPSAFRACVTSVRLQTGMKGADRLEFGVFNENLRWLDHDLVKPGNPVAFRIGYAPDQLPMMFYGKLVSVQASFPSSGTPSLQLAAQDALSDMQNGKQTRWFAKDIARTGNAPVPPRDVARSVLDEYGLQARFDEQEGVFSQVVGEMMSFLSGRISDINPTQSQQGVEQQVKSTDFELLQKIAKDLGYDMFLDHSGPRPGVVLFFGPWRNMSPALELHYGRSLQEFSPKESDIGQSTEVTANVWSSDEKTTVNVTLKWSWEQNTFHLSLAPGKAEAGKQGKSLIIDEPLTLLTAPARLVSELMPKLNSRLTATGSIVGNPAVRTGAVLKITGVGERFGGYYRVTDCTHSLDGSGYRTQFEVRKEVWFLIPKSVQGKAKVQLPSALGKALGR